jgi:hypothetical protein
VVQTLWRQKLYVADLIVPNKREGERKDRQRMKDITERKNSEREREKETEGEHRDRESRKETHWNR